MKMQLIELQIGSNPVFCFLARTLADTGTLSGVQGRQTACFPGLQKM
jgi:hypothetical protein